MQEVNFKISGIADFEHYGKIHSVRLQSGISVFSISKNVFYFLYIFGARHSLAVLKNHLTGTFIGKALLQRFRTSEFLGYHFVDSSPPLLPVFRKH